MGHPLQTDSGPHRLENPTQPLTFDLHVALAAGALAHVEAAAGALVDVEEAAGSSVVEQHHAGPGEAPMQKGSLVPHLPFRFWTPTPEQSGFQNFGSKGILRLLEVHDV